MIDPRIDPSTLPWEDYYEEGGILPFPESHIRWRPPRGDLTQLPCPVVPEDGGEPITTVADLIIYLAFYPVRVPA